MLNRLQEILNTLFDDVNNTRYYHSLDEGWSSNLKQSDEAVRGKTELTCRLLAGVTGQHSLPDIDRLIKLLPTACRLFRNHKNLSEERLKQEGQKLARRYSLILLQTAIKNQLYKRKEFGKPQVVIIKCTSRCPFESALLNANTYEDAEAIDISEEKFRKTYPHLYEKSRKRRMHENP